MSVVRSPDNEAVVLGIWDDYDREGLPGILRWAADDAVWRPHSSRQSVFHSTADYRASVEDALARGVSVDSIRLGIWSHDDVVAVRGRLRVRQGGLLSDVGLPGRANEAYLAMHDTEGVG